MKAQLEEKAAALKRLQMQCGELRIQLDEVQSDNQKKG